MSKEKKHQISISGGRVMEYNEIEDSYLKRHWKKFKNINDFIKFISSKPFKKYCLSEGMQLSMISQDETNKILHFGINPEIEDKESIEEYIFESKEAANNFIQEKKLKPSSNLLDDASKDQLNKFFSGEKCFFQGAQELQQEYLQKRNKIEASDQHAEFLLGMEYEQKIVDILINY